MPEQNLKALKTLVISMGIMLVVGFFVICIAAWMKIKTPEKTVAAASECVGGKVDLTGRGHVVDTNYSGNLLRITLAKPSGEIEVAQVDMCSGKQLGSVKITTDALPEQ